MVVFKEGERGRSDKHDSGPKRKENLVKELESILKEEGKVIRSLCVTLIYHLSHRLCHVSN